MSDHPFAANMPGVPHELYHITVDDRLHVVRKANIDKLLAILAMGDDLQVTVRKAAEARLRKLLKALREDYARYMATWNGRTQWLTTPCCKLELRVTAPDELGETWDSMMRCPHCGELFWFEGTRDAARGFIPQEAH